MGAVSDILPVTNFSLQDLSTVQRKHEIWAGVIYTLETRDEATLPRLPIPFSQFFLSQDNVLCRHWPEKTESVEQYVIPKTYVPVVLKLIHDMSIAGRPGHSRTLAAARRIYYWQTMRVDIDRYVAQCISCAKHKDTTKGPAPLL